MVSVNENEDHEVKCGGLLGDEEYDHTQCQILKELVKSMMLHYNPEASCDLEDGRYGISCIQNVVYNLKSPQLAGRTLGPAFAKSCNNYGDQLKPCFSACWEPGFLNLPLTSLCYSQKNVPFPRCFALSEIALSFILQGAQPKTPDPLSVCCFPLLPHFIRFSNKKKSFYEDTFEVLEAP